MMFPPRGGIGMAHGISTVNKGAVVIGPLYTFHRRHGSFMQD